MTEKAEAFGAAMAEAAEAVARATGWDGASATLALITLYGEYARQVFGTEDRREVARMKSIEESQADIAAFRDALIREGMPKPPKKKWWSR
jgi:hypothetical protein